MSFIKKFPRPLDVYSYLKKFRLIRACNEFVVTPRVGTISNEGAQRTNPAVESLGFNPPYFVDGKENRPDGFNIGVEGVFNATKSFRHSQEGKRRIVKVNDEYKEVLKQGTNNFYFVDWRGTDPADVLHISGPFNRYFPIHAQLPFIFTSTYWGADGAGSNWGIRQGDPIVLSTDTRWTYDDFITYHCDNVAQVPDMDAAPSIFDGTNCAHNLPDVDDPKILGAAIWNDAPTKTKWIVAIAYGNYQVGGNYVSDHVFVRRLSTTLSTGIFDQATLNTLISDWKLAQESDKAAALAAIQVELDKWVHIGSFEGNFGAFNSTVIETQEPVVKGKARLKFTELHGGWFFNASGDECKCIRKVITDVTSFELFDFPNNANDPGRDFVHHRTVSTPGDVLYLWEYDTEMTLSPTLTVNEIDELKGVTDDRYFISGSASLQIADQSRTNMNWNNSSTLTEQVVQSITYTTMVANDAIVGNVTDYKVAVDYIGDVAHYLYIDKAHTRSQATTVFGQGSGGSIDIFDQLDIGVGVTSGALTQTVTYHTSNGMSMVMSHDKNTFSGTYTFATHYQLTLADVEPTISLNLVYVDIRFDIMVASGFRLDRGVQTFIAGDFLTSSPPGDNVFHQKFGNITEHIEKIILGPFSVENLLRTDTSTEDRAVTLSGDFGGDSGLAAEGWTATLVGARWMHNLQVFDVHTGLYSSANYNIVDTHYYYTEVTQGGGIKPFKNNQFHGAPALLRKDITNPLFTGLADDPSNGWHNRVIFPSSQDPYMGVAVDDNRIYILSMIQGFNVPGTSSPFETGPFKIQSTYNIMTNHNLDTLVDLVEHDGKKKAYFPLAWLGTDPG